MSVASRVRERMPHLVKQPFEVGVGTLNPFEQRIAFETLITLISRELVDVSKIDSDLGQSHSHKLAPYTNGFVHDFFGGAETESNNQNPEEALPKHWDELRKFYHEVHRLVAESKQ